MGTCKTAESRRVKEASHRGGASDISLGKDAGVGLEGRYEERAVYRDTRIGGEIRMTLKYSLGQSRQRKADRWRL